jgi:hypothetical protein
VVHTTLSTRKYAVSRRQGSISRTWEGERDGALEAEVVHYACEGNIAAQQTGRSSVTVSTQHALFGIDFDAA